LQHRKKESELVREKVLVIVQKESKRKKKSGIAREKERCHKKECVHDCQERERACNKDDKTLQRKMLQERKKVRLLRERHITCRREHVCVSRDTFHRYQDTLKQPNHKLEAC